MFSSLFKQRHLLAGVASTLLVLGIVVSRSFGAAQLDRARVVPAVPVKVAVVDKRNIAQSVGGVGNVQSLHTVVLRPQVSGVATQVLFKEGQMVRSGELLARIDDRSIVATLKQAEAQKARNVALLEAAELDLARYDNLLYQEAVSRQLLEQQRAAVQQLRAAILGDEAAITAAQVQLSYTRITTPISGRAGFRHVDAGNLVQAGELTGLATVTQLDPISVVFTLPEGMLARVKPLLQGSSSAEVLAFERDGGMELARGRLTMIDNQIDVASGTVRLRGEFPNPQGALWPGQFVAVQLLTGVAENATVVPARSVLQGLDGSFVFRVRNSRAEVARVSISHSEGELAVIREGLMPGELVVTDGQSRLKAGSAVSAEGPAVAVTELVR